MLRERLIDPPPPVLLLKRGDECLVSHSGRGIAVARIHHINEEHRFAHVHILATNLQ
jgi:hypothetical protein